MGDYVAMTYYGHQWEYTKQLHRDSFDTIDQAIEAGLKSKEYSPNLCIWIAQHAGQDQYLQPRFRTIKYIQYPEKAKELEQGWSDWLHFLHPKNKPQPTDEEYKVGSYKRTAFLKELIERSP